MTGWFNTKKLSVFVVMTLAALNLAACGDSTESTQPTPLISKMTAAISAAPSPTFRSAATSQPAPTTSAGATTSTTVIPTTAALTTTSVATQNASNSAGNAQEQARKVAAAMEQVQSYKINITNTAGEKFEQIYVAPSSIYSAKTDSSGKKHFIIELEDQYFESEDGVKWQKSQFPSGELTKDFISLSLKLGGQITGGADQDFEGRKVGQLVYDFSKATGFATLGKGKVLYDKTTFLIIQEENETTNSSQTRSSVISYKDYNNPNNKIEPPKL